MSLSTLHCQLLKGPAKSYSTYCLQPSVQCLAYHKEMNERREGKGKNGGEKKKEGARRETEEKKPTCREAKSDKCSNPYLSKHGQVT